MNRIKIEFPVFVRNFGDGKYVVRPLFIREPKKQKQRFQSAYNSLIGSVRNLFRSTIIGQNNYEQLLWFKYNPEVTVHKIKLSFDLGKDFVHQFFSYSTFKLNDRMIIHFPDFADQMYIAVNSNPQHVEFREQVEDLVRSMLRSAKNDQDHDFKLENYKSAKTEFVTTTEFYTFILHEKIDANDDPGIFATINDESEFNGYEELWEVGSSLHDLYPDELQEASYRAEEAEHLKRIMFGGEVGGVVLLGPEGAGKTTLIHQALLNYLKEAGGTSNESARDIYHIDPNKVIAGMSVVGQWQQRFESILKVVIDQKRELEKAAPDFIYFDNPVALFRVGQSSQNNMTLSHVLRSYVEKRQLPVILEATREEWKLIQELDRRFADLFRVIRVPEVSQEKAIDIIQKNRRLIELTHPVKIENDTLFRMFSIQRQYMRSEALPGSLVKYMQQLATKYTGEVNDETLIRDFSERSTLRRDMFTKNTLKAGEVENALAKRLIGQKAAIDAMADVIHLINAKLNDPEKPLATLLFTGPTGVGKTQAAKVMADYLFESEDNLVRFDMNEYIDAGAIHRLIGGFNNPEGQLTGRIRYNPYCVLLLDEIEKAHPDVHDLLLQVLGEGRLSDFAGHTVDFTNTIIIMTSNLGAEAAERALGYVNSENSQADTFRKAIENFFRPELINRIDEIVIFQQLKLEEVMLIAEIMISELLLRDGFIRRSTMLKLDSAALKTIAEKGFDPAMGARSLKRRIEKEVIGIAAEKLLTISGNTPIIFELFLVNNKLIPRITPLKYIVPEKLMQLPKPESAEIHRDTLEQLYDAFDALEQEIMDYRDTTETDSGGDFVDEGDMDLLTLIDEVRNARAFLVQVVMDMQFASQRKLPFNFNFKKRGSSIKYGHVWSLDYSHFKDMDHELEIRAYFDDILNHATQIVDDTDQILSACFIKLAFLKYFKDAWVKGHFDFVKVSLRMPVAQGGEPAFGLNKLAVMHLWDEWSFLEKVVSGGGDYVDGEKFAPEGYELYFSGPGIFNLLNYEDGIHLFSTGNNLITIDVTVEKLLEDEYVAIVAPEHLSDEQKDTVAEAKNSVNNNELPDIKSEVIRFYTVDTENRFNESTIDLRSGIVFKSSVFTQRDAELLLFNNIPEDFKPI